MAKTLGVTIEEILGLERPGQKKRGPQSQLERQLAAIASLPGKEQQQLLARRPGFRRPTRRTVNDRR
jgi:hypothetical protein